MQRAEPIRPTVKDYASWSEGNRDVPTKTAVSKRKTWPEWMRMVDEMLLELNKAA